MDFKEHDLMYIGSGQSFAGKSPDEEVRLFYRGYGVVEIDRDTLANYRFEHIIKDIAVECDHIFAVDANGRIENTLSGSYLLILNRAIP